MKFKKNDVIIPAEETYPAMALRVDSWDGDDLMAYPIGGGFGLRFDADSRAKYNFRVVNLDVERPTWKRAKFSIDGGESFEGYHNDVRWNGWAQPMFPLESIRSLIDYWNKRTVGPNAESLGGIYTIFDEKHDRVCMFDRDGVSDSPKGDKILAEQFGFTDGGGSDILPTAVSIPNTNHFVIPPPVGEDALDDAMRKFHASEADSDTCFEYPWQVFEGERIARKGIDVMTLYEFGSGWIWDAREDDE